MSVLTAVDLILAIPTVILAITPPLHDLTFPVGAVEPVCSLLTELSCRHRPECMTEVREVICSLLTELSCRHRPECMTEVREVVCSLLTELSCRHRPECMTEVREAVCSLLKNCSVDTDLSV